MELIHHCYEKCYHLTACTVVVLAQDVNSIHTYIGGNIMKHPIAFKCFVLAAILAANGCTYDNLDKLNQTTDDGQGRERQCEVSKCDLPKQQEGVSVSAHYSPSENGCVCDYKCDTQNTNIRYVSSGSGVDLICTPKCLTDDYCKQVSPDTPTCKTDTGECIADGPCSEVTCAESNNPHVVGTPDVANNCECVYSCEGDYEPLDNDVATIDLVCRCKDDTDCSADTPKCSADGVCESCEDICNDPIDPDNHKGVVVGESKWESGECSCKYACDEEHGFEMAANSDDTLAKIHCEQNKCFEECSGQINENTPGVVVSGSKMVGEQCNCEYSCDSQNKYEKVGDGSDILVCAQCGNELCMKRLEGKQNVVVDFEWNSENNSCNCNYSCSEDYHPENNNVTDANINCISCLDGENCGNERYCCENSAWNCTSGMCFDQKNIGEECYNNAQCKTGTCDTSKHECIESTACKDEECCQKIGQHWSVSECVECLAHEQCGQDRFCKNHICTQKYNVGATCDGFEGIECKSGMCVERSLGSGTSVCACDDGANQCGSGKVCLNQLCVPGNVAVGSDCIDTKQCVLGSVCEQDKCKCNTKDCCMTNETNKEVCCNTFDSGKHWSTKQEVCVQKLIADDSCEFGDFCGNDLYCSNYSKTCKNKLLGGENCKDGSSDNNKACMSNSCSNSICKCNSSVNCKDGNKVCSDNGLCVECTESKPCSGAKYCDSNNTCKEKKDNGKTCSKDNECKSGHCNGTKCVECTEQSHCDGDKYCCEYSTWGCVVNKCENKLDGGVKANHGEQCKSKYLVDNECRCEIKDQVLVAPCVENGVCNCIGPNCRAKCVEAGSGNEGDACFVENYCGVGMSCESYQCMCVNGAYRYDSERNVVQQCSNNTFSNVNLWYYNYLLSYECPSENAFDLEYASRNASSLEASFEDIIGNTAWCELVQQYLDGTVEAMEVYSPGNFEIEPMCLAYGNKAFELNTYSGDLHLNSCQYGCNTNFTLCHQDVMYSSYCDSNVLNMTYYVNNGYNEWQDDLVSISNPEVYGQGNLCYSGILLYLKKCELRKPDTSDSFSGVCTFYKVSSAHEVASSYPVCIDFYNKETYEKRSFAFGLTGNSISIDVNATPCPNGCNSNYSGCK